MDEGNVLQFANSESTPPRAAGRLPIILTKLTGSSQSEPLKRTDAPRRILVVDDDKDGVASLSMLLTMVGHETTVAHDGVEAVDVAENFKPHIVLLDLDLPKLNGYDVCRQMRAASWGNQALIVAVTGWPDESHRQEALAAGFDMHLVKPVSAEVFMTVLSAAS
jgi:DNA-binding response OmpR family regulator